jgi:drug/metabolite transporter (DMT)-like permease
MTAMAHDGASVAAPVPAARRSPTSVGLALAVVSALSFSLSGPLAGGLFVTGWSPGAVVLVRVAIGTLVVLPFGIAALRGDWTPVRRSWRVVLAYGVLGVAGAQFCYFAAIQHMQVGPALLIEYTAPAAVVAWFWARHGQRPGGLTLLGVGLAAAGLVLVLDLSGAAPSGVGVAWSLAAMVGAATYFVINARTDTGLPPLTLAAGGLVVGTVLLGALGVTGLMPLTVADAPVELAGTAVPVAVVLGVLGLITAGLSYVTGVLAGRRLGARRASFVGLLEVVSAVALAWLLLGELPAAVQLLGGLLVLAGVVAVQQGEAATARRSLPIAPATPLPTAPTPPTP